MKKKALWIFCFCCITCWVKAQRNPQYTQYALNGFIINPAIAGIENYTDLRFGSRLQWTGLQGAPTTRYVSVHAPLGKDFLFDNASSMSGQGSNPMSRSYVQTYQAAAPHHGIGLRGMTDEAGPLKRTDINLSYAYHLGISDQINMSLGVSAGFTQLILDGAALVLEDASDPVMFNYAKNRMAPDASAGLWLYGPRFFGGLAVHNLLKNDLLFASTSGQAKIVNKVQYFGILGYKLNVTEDLALIPSMLMNYADPLPVSIDVNVKLAFKDKFWLGGGYRKGDAFSANAGFNIGYLLNLGYAYDFTTSKLNTVSRGSHEIVLGILLNNRYRVTCPQKNW